MRVLLLAPLLWLATAAPPADAEADVFGAANHARDEELVSNHRFGDRFQEGRDSGVVADAEFAAQHGISAGHGAYHTSTDNIPGWPVVTWRHGLCSLSVSRPRLSRSLPIFCSCSRLRGVRRRRAPPAGRFKRTGAPNPVPGGARVPAADRGARSVQVALGIAQRIALRIALCVALCLAQRVSQRLPQRVALSEPQREAEPVAHAVPHPQREREQIHAPLARRARHGAL